MTTITVDRRMLVLLVVMLFIGIWVGKHQWRKLAGTRQDKGAFAYIFIAVALLVLFLAAWMAGANTIQCQRVEPRQVNCTTHHTRWLGLVAGAAITLTDVQTARLASASCTQTVQVNGEEHPVTDTCTNLVLVTVTGEVRPALSAELLPALNHFLHSTQPVWAYAQINCSLALTLACFALIFGGIGACLVSVKEKWQ